MLTCFIKPEYLFFKFYLLSNKHFQLRNEIYVCTCNKIIFIVVLMIIYHIRPKNMLVKHEIV